MMGNEITRFLLAGGLAAAINWLARLTLSFALPLEMAILVAYAIGMLAGFFLYRHFVFRNVEGPIGRQIAVFLVVNAFGAMVVLAATFSLMTLIEFTTPTLKPALIAALAHGFAIGIGAITNYLGHSALTYRQRTDHLASQRR
jgi:energy-coupling factor transport system substrate-specific component